MWHQVAGFAGGTVVVSGLAIVWVAGKREKMSGFSDRFWLGWLAGFSVLALLLGVCRARRAIVGHGAVRGDGLAAAAFGLSAIAIAVAACWFRRTWKRPRSRTDERRAGRRAVVEVLLTMLVLAGMFVALVRFGLGAGIAAGAVVGILVLRVLDTAREARTGRPVAAWLPHWPASLSIGPLQRHHTGGRVLTGDTGFDERFQIDGDERAWRATLTPEVREQLIEIADRWPATVWGRRIEIALGRSNSHELEEAQQLAAGLVDRLAPLPDDLAGRILELAPRETIASVRRGHYEWLLAAGASPADVFRAAAHDPDPDIAAWGRAQVPAEDDVFR